MGWLSLAISLLAHFKLIVSRPLVSHSDIGSNDHGGKEVGGREMKVSKIKKEKTEKKGKSKKEKVSKVKKTKGSSSKTEVVCPEINDRRLDMLGFNIDSGNLLKKFRSNLGNIATGANFMKDLNIPKIAETVTDVSSPSIRRIQGSDDGDVRTLEHDATNATLCPNGNPVTKPDKDITEYVMLMMSFLGDKDDVDENYNDANDDNDEDDENDEVDLEMFLSYVVGGTTCKDLENWVLLTEDSSATDFYSMFIFFCGCEGVQSATFCPNGNPVTKPDKDITEFLMLMMYDENDLEMFLSFLKVAVGGTTCKDLENWFLLTEDWSATDFSIFTIFCGCEGVQSATFCPNGNPVTTPDKDITEFVMLIMSLDDDEDDVGENYNDKNDRILEHDNDE